MYSLIYAKNIEWTSNISYIDSVCFPGNSWSEDLIQKDINSHSAKYLICEDCDVTVGYLCFRHILNETEIDRIAVLPNYRNKGVGSALISELFRLSELNNISRITLEVRKGNICAVSLYKKFGFTEDCIRKNYYTNPTEDAVLMSVSLKK